MSKTCKGCSFSRAKRVDNRYFTFCEKLGFIAPLVAPKCLYFSRRFEGSGSQVAPLRLEIPVELL